MSSKPVILGFDGSAASRKALSFAAQFAHRFNAPVVVIHVIDWSPFEIQTLEENEQRPVRRRELIQADREQLFPPVLSALADAGVEAEATVKFGHPAEVLSAEAKARDALALVVGKTGLSKVKNLLFGSTASNAALLSERPVIVVP